MGDGQVPWTGSIQKQIGWLSKRLPANSGAAVLLLNGQALNTRGVRTNVPVVSGQKLVDSSKTLRISHYMPAWGHVGIARVDLIRFFPQGLGPVLEELANRQNATVSVCFEVLI